MAENFYPMYLRYKPEGDHCYSLWLRENLHDYLRTTVFEEDKNLTQERKEDIHQTYLHYPEQRTKFATWLREKYETND